MGPFVLKNMYIWVLSFLFCSILPKKPSHSISSYTSAVGQCYL